MDSSEERLKVLQMIQNGKITAEEGMRLLETLGQKPTAQADPSEAQPTRTARWFRFQRGRYQLRQSARQRAHAGQRDQRRGQDGCTFFS